MVALKSSPSVNLPSSIKATAFAVTSLTARARESLAIPPSSRAPIAAPVIIPGSLVLISAAAPPIFSPADLIKAPEMTLAAAIFFISLVRPVPSPLRAAIAPLATRVAAFEIPSSPVSSAKAKDGIAKAPVFIAAVSASVIPAPP